MRTKTGGAYPSMGKHLPTRILSLFMALILTLGVLPIPAAAADTRTDIPSSIRIDGNSYTKYGSYNSSTLGASCTIHDITANIGGGQYRTVFCGDHGKRLTQGTWNIKTLIDGSNYAKADGPMRAPYMMFADYYYAKGYGNPTTNAWCQAAVWLMRGSNSRYDFLIKASVEEIESGMYDSFFMEIADDAVRAAKTVSPGYSGTVEQMKENLKQAVAIPWLKGEIPHLDYVLYYRNNEQQHLLLGLPHGAEGPNVWLKVQKVDSRGKALAGARFGVYDTSNTDGEPLDTITTDSSGIAFYEYKLQTGETSKTLYVKELQAPPNCKLDPAVYPVEMKLEANNAKEKAALVAGKALVNYQDTSTGTPSGFMKVDQYGNGVGGAIFRIEGEDVSTSSSSSISYSSGLINDGSLNALSVQYAGSSAFELPVAGSTGFAQKAMTAGSLKLSAGQAFTIVEETSSGGWKIKTADGEGELSAANVKWCMINLPDVLPSIAYNMVNASSAIYKSSGVDIPNITGKQLYTAGQLPNARFGGKSMYLAPINYEVAKKLASAQKAAQAQGKSLLIYDTFRPYDVQVAVGKNLGDLMDSNATVKSNIEDGKWGKNWFISSTTGGGRSNHQRGIAVDLSLCTVTNKESVTMGDTTVEIPTSWNEVSTPSAMHELSNAGTTYTSGSSTTYTDKLKNSEVFALQSVMKNAGFTPLASEWWHFDGLAKASVPSDIKGEFQVTQCLSTAPEKAAEEGGTGSGEATPGGGGGSGTGTGSGSGSGSSTSSVSASDTPNVSGGRVEHEVMSLPSGEIPLQWTDPTLPNYIAPGHYTVREIRAPAGYRTTDEVRHVDLHEDGSYSGNLIFVNEKLRTIKLIKQDDSGKGLPGAVFKVERNGQDFGSVTTGDDGTVVLEGEDGTGLLPGLYTLTEVSAPDGYLLPANPVHQVYLFPEGSTVEQYVVTATNYQHPDIEIEKISRETGEGLAGATFEVRINAQTIDTFKTGSDGKIRLTYAEYGRFLNPQGAKSWTVSVREITAPDGYLIDDENWQEAEMHQGEKLKTFTFTDTRYPYIRILKRDRETGEPLPNTTFKVWIDGKDIGTKVTDEFGVITIDYKTYARFLDEHNHDNWTITVQEEEMPAFYNKDKQDATGDYTQTQTLKWGQSYAEFTFKDTHFRDLRITKRDLSNTWTLADATFTLDSINLENEKGGPIHREGKTDGNGQLTFKDLPNGTYRVTETVPPTGYSLADPNWQDVTITSYSDRVIDIQFLNAPEQGLLIRKLDATTRQNLAGVSFEVRFLGTADSPNGTTNDPRTYVTDANGLIYLPDCEPGWYQITETAVPDGYIIDSEPRLVQIVNKHEPVTVTYENYQDTQLIILKKDAQTSLPLPGALFEITTAGGNYIATVETGPNGIGTLAGLEPGAYVITEVEAPDGHIIDPVPQTFEIRRGQTEPVFKVFYNDGKTNLFIRKEDAQTHIGLADAVYKVTLSDGKVIKERLVTGEDGLASLTDLLPGTYVVTEIEAPPGYLLNSTPQHVYLDEGRTETMLFRNNKPGGIAVLKRDAISGLPLAGAVFEHRTLDGELIGKEPLTTGLDGYIRVPDLDAGWYILREVEAPDGYLLDSTDHRVYVEDFKVTYVYLDNYQKAGLTVNKIDSESKLPLAGAEFEVRDMKNSVLKTITTNSSGVATLTDIAPGWYKVVETKAPDGYVLNEKENLVQIVEGKPASVTVPNTKQSGITVHKVDATSREPLAGAEFELRTADGKLIDTYTTDVSGSFVTTNVEPGVYFLVEKKAPKGYAISTEDTKVIVPEGEYPVVTIENHKGTSIEILKVDSVTGKYLAGAEFEVYTLNCEKLLGVYTTDKTGVAFTEPLPAGNYIVKESKAPEGYILDDSHHHVQVLYDHPAKLKVENVPLTGIMITKLSAVDDTPLMGAKFEIRTAEGKVVGEFTTDTAGDPIFAVEPGVYYVHETKAPDNYLLNDEVFRVEVTAGKIVPLVVRDNPACELVIFKGDAGNKKGIAGAVFKVETADHDFIGTYTTDAQGEAIVRPIAPGHYIVTEMSAPEGYSVSETPKTITVKVGVINRVEFVDAAMGSLVIRLEDQADGHKLENGRFQLYFAATGKLVNEGVTDNSGSIVWGSLLPGRYIIKQTYAPDGYTIIDAEKEGIVVSGETTIVVFKDYTAGLVIEKVDRLTGETLAGARFQVTRNSDNFVIGEYETDSNGLALVSGLTEGMYSVEELKAPTGYAIDEEAKLVHVKVGTEAHVTFQDTPNAGITIQTVDKDTQAPLSGVVIEVWQQNGVLVNTYTSDTTGVIQTDKLTAGFYVLRVIKAENGYKAVTIEQTVEIKNGTAVTVKFEFVARGLLQVYSLDNKEVGLPGMKVTITKQNGELVGNYATDTNGLLTVEGLEPGWYIVKETNPPSGYTIGSEDSQSIEITSNGTATVKFYHGKTYGVQIRTSVKQTGVMVAGVKYQITTLEGTMVGTFTSDNVGIAYATLEPGWYVIKMIELPEGYKNFSLCAERRVEVKADAPTIIDFQLTQLSSIRVKFVNGTTGAAIYGVRVMLKDSTGKIVDEYTSNNEGYITLKQNVVNGTYTLEQISVPSGYTVDKVPKTIEVLNGETTEITWKMFTEGGQIQVHLTSTAYNSTLDLAAGSNLQGGVFEIYDPFTFAVLATITTDSYGVAASGVLPIGRYIIRQKTAPAYFGMTDNNGPVKETEVYIKINNDVVRTEYQNSPMNLKVTHKVTGNNSVAAGSSMKYLFTAVNNDSAERLDNYYWTITVPTDAMRAGTLFTGTWSSSVYYSISYKTNQNDYRPLASGLNSATPYQYDLSSLAINVNGGEYVTHIRFEFGTVPSGFKPTQAPIFFGYVIPGVVPGYKVILRSECGGKYNGAWATSSALWTTAVAAGGSAAKAPRVASTPNRLPTTGY